MEGSNFTSKMFTKELKNSLKFLEMFALLLMIWPLCLIECNWNPTHNHLVHKRTLKHLAKLAKWLSCVVSTYLYGAFDRMSITVDLTVLSLMEML